MHAVNAYLSLKTAEERRFASGHVLWLREQARNVRGIDAAEAEELEAAATELEMSIRRVEWESNGASQNHDEDDR